MLTLSEVRGQPRVVEVLQRALEGQRVAQAYLFAGPAGCGKHTTGLALAKALNCLAQPERGCHECESCNKIDAGIHPDVQTLERQGTKQHIPIATIRKQVIPSLALPPHEGRARVFLIEEATSLQNPAANALLKTLEEPPSRTHFILGCVSPIQLLPTIRSRCQRINFQALPADLKATMAGDEESAETIRGLSDAILRVADERGLGPILDVATGASDRGILLGALSQCAQLCHLRARRAAESGMLPTAKVHGARATMVLETMAAVRDHNAHGQLAVEGMLVALRSLPLPEVAR